MNSTATNDTAVAQTFYGEQALALIAYSILMLSVLAGNGLIISAFAYNKHLRTLTNILVIGLSSADFLVGLISIPCWISIIVYQFNKMTYRAYAYQFYITADIFIGTASILQLTCISIERCHAVMAPLQHRLVPRRIFCATVVGVWLFSGGIATLNQFQNDWRNVYTLLAATIDFFIPTAVILVAYICIFRHSRGGRTLTRHRSSQAALARELRLSATVCLITFVFIISWLPLFSISMAFTFKPDLSPDETTSRRVIAFVKWMHYSSSALNPFLYSYRNNELRKTIKFMTCKFLFRKNLRRDDLYSKSRRSSVFSLRSSFSFSFSAIRKNSRPTSVSSQNSTGSQRNRKRSDDANNNSNRNNTEQAVITIGCLDRNNTEQAV